MEEITFERDDKGEICPTIQNFYKYCGHGRLMGVKCSKCGKLLVPPRTLCPDCYSTSFRWIQLSGKAKLQTYSTVHIPPKRFAAEAPYTIGIVKLEEGVNLPSRIHMKQGEEAYIGMDLIVEFEASKTDEWPQWPRYYFKTIK